MRSDVNETFLGKLGILLQNYQLERVAMRTDHPSRLACHHRSLQSHVWGAVHSP
jgi:hypothetical protein